MKEYSNKQFQVVVFDNYAGSPLKITFIGGRWWVTTIGMKLQPLEKFAGAEDIGFSYLCEAGGKVGSLAVAKMLGKALENPEDRADEVLRHRVKSQKRLGVTLDVKDEPLVLEMDVISNEGCPARHGKYSLICHLHGNYFETIFDIDAFESKLDAEEWASYFFEVLEEIGIEFKII